MRIRRPLEALSSRPTAAGRAAKLGKRVLLLEKNRVLGKKLSISGGGRCNILNVEESTHELLSHYGDDGKYLSSSYAQFGMRDTYRFFEARGLQLKIEKNKRAFPKSNQAKDVVATLEHYMKEGSADVQYNVRISEFRHSGKQIEAVVQGDQEIRARSFILATGGLSHPETGSTGDGFRWLSNLGFSINEPTPTIVPVRTAESWTHRLAGVSIEDAKLSFYKGDKKTFSRRGPLLFTHFGLSGPTILNAAGSIAGLLEEDDVKVRIDSYPNEDIGGLDKRIIALFDANKNKVLKNVYADIAPPGAAKILLTQLLELDPEKRVHSVTKEERRLLVNQLKGLQVTITSLMGFDRAVVADGGVSLDDINTKTFATHMYQNLYLVGDLLHVRRPSGGYSLQLAWTSGYVAGTHA